MACLEQMDIKLDGIGHIISDRMLAVPMCQRSYAWTAKKQVAEFIQDLSAAIRHGEKE